MGREKLPEMLGREKAWIVDRDELLCSHEAGLDDRARQHDQSEYHIHDADLLVIEARQPVRPQRRPPAFDSQQNGDCERTNHHDPAGAGGDKFTCAGMYEGRDEDDRRPVEDAEYRRGRAGHEGDPAGMWSSECWGDDCAGS